ncbi:MAG: protein phosphatase 2C domain-containing protein [Pseudomonadota bacterium]
MIDISEDLPGYSFIASGVKDSAGNEAMDGCEDAEPLIERLSDGRIFACVADGLGGYSHGFDGKSGGFIACRTVSRGALEFFQRFPQKSPEIDAFSLTDYLHRKLQHLAALKLTPTRVKGTLAHHKLASTLACMLIQEKQDGSAAIVRLYWIGDSRIYFLTDSGLFLLTRDDTRANVDAYEGLFQDSPMSQFLAASMEKTWRINARELVIGKPGVLVACTDGCTAYWKRPWDFELTLMAAFETSDNWNEWVHRIKHSLDSVRADDASLIAWPLNTGDFAGFSATMLEKRHKSAGAKAARTAALEKMPDQQIWRKIYRPSFQKLLAENDESTSGWRSIIHRIKQIAQSLWPFT